MFEINKALHLLHFKNRQKVGEIARNSKKKRNTKLKPRGENKKLIHTNVNRQK